MNNLYAKSGYAVCKIIADSINNKKVSKHLTSHHVRHIILKGCTTDKFYPSEIIRTSADVDIFVDKRDFESAKEALQELGFYFEKTNDNEEFHFKKDPRYYIEVHTTLEGFSDRQKKILLKLSDNAVKVSGERYELTDSDAYIYSMFHLYKHFVFSGVGVRMFLDNYLIEKNGNIDFT